MNIDKISKAELAYLTMHIERLSNTIMHSKDSNSLDCNIPFCVGKDREVIETMEHVAVQSSQVSYSVFK